MSLAQPAPEPDPVRPGPDMRVLWALVGVIMAIELLAQAHGAGLPGLSRRWLLAHGGFWPVLLGGEGAIYPGQGAAMFLSYAFLHGGIGHALLNCTILLAVGRLVLMLGGAGRMLALFALTAVAGAIGYALLGGEAYVPMVGASGAGFGFIAAWKRWDYIALKARGLDTRPVLQFGLALVAASVAMHFLSAGTVAWEGHLFGALAGWFIAPSVLRGPRRRR
ncbi:rhomboid family intramembrane serine protease [Roseobacter sp. HKCCA0434]|uniref:rhomboid family intramembrane serine protease n=1 Tax=Roseobacter sp. HKCCA0434 TaxID=3079297 RepID=UPI002905D19E|nr:rhomboid family intramembrane serine protease [Roseobacter sp. HKCCA0434]